MGGSVVILFFMPWLDQSPVKSIRYRPDWHKAVYCWCSWWCSSILGYLGIEPPDPFKTALSQVGTLIYFGFFLLMPWWSQMGTFKPVPGPHRLPRALIAMKKDTLMKRFIASVLVAFSFCGAAFPPRKAARRGTSSPPSASPTRWPCSTAPSCSSTTA